MLPRALIPILGAALLLAGCGGADKPLGPRPAALKITTGLGVGIVLQPATPQPVIQLIDATGQPVPEPGIVVTASIASGDVKIVEGATATTDDFGEARFANLTFGALTANAGNFEVRYSAPGLGFVGEQEAITCRSASAGPGQVVTGELRDGDCLFAGKRYRYYNESGLGSRRAIRITQTASAFAPAVFVRKTYDVDKSFMGLLAAAPGSASFKLLVPSDQSVQFLASSSEPNAFGQFQFRVDVVPESEPGCEDVFFMTPVTSQQSLDGCTDDQGRIGDGYLFLLDGRGLTVTVTSSVFTPYISIWSLEPKTRLAEKLGTGGSATLTFGTDSRVYYMFVSSSTGAATGAYTIQLTASS